MEFKDLTFKKKIEHIWEYYKVHILGTLLFAVIIGSWIYNAKFRPQKELFAGLAIIDYRFPDNYYDDPLYNRINEALGLEGTDSEVRIEYFYDDPSQPDFMSNMIDKFGAMLLTGDVNMMIMNEASMVEYAANDYLLDLSLVYTDEELENMEKEGMLIKTASELDSNEKYYAVSLKNSTSMTDMPGFDPGENYIGIFGAVEEWDNQKQVMDYLIR